MAINLSAGVFDFYNESLELFVRPMVLVYPPKREDCPNCRLETLGVRSSRSISVYVQGGPLPFSRGMPCPYCNGKGYKEIETTDTIDARIYWDRRYWVNIGVQLNLPDGAVQTITKMDEYTKISRCEYMIPNYDGIEKYSTKRFKRASEPYPQGFKQNPIKYVVTFWTVSTNA
jgi:hypothetical protein